MNQILIRNQLEQALSSYICLLPYCSTKNFTKLANEIIRIFKEIERLKQLPISELNQKVKFRTVKKQSIINFKDV